MLQEISLILNVILASTSLYLFVKKRELEQLEAEKNYNHVSLELTSIFEQNKKEYRKRALELGAYLDENGEFSRNSFRGIDQGELESLNFQQENNMERKRNELRYWAKIGRVNILSGKPISLKEDILAKSRSIFRYLKNPCKHK